MATKIEWAEDTWNPFTGCTKISPGCKHCYAEKFAQRFKGRFGYPKDDPFKFTFHPERLDIPGRWRKRKKIFVCSMSDLFHTIEEPFEQHIKDILHIMDLHRQHIYIILTKRADNMYWFFEKNYYDLEKDYPHIWIGVTVENTKHGLPRIDLLRKVNASVRFLSIEPLLEDLGTINLTGIHWVIVGGEKTRPRINARSIEIEWVRSLRNQCTTTGTPFFFKQWGEYGPNWFNDNDGNLIPGSEWMDCMGHKMAGRILDGRTWDQYPEVATI